MQTFLKGYFYLPDEHYRTLIAEFLSIFTHHIQDVNKGTSTAWFITGGTIPAIRPVANRDIMFFKNFLNQNYSIFTIMNSLGYGCSDAATVFIMGGTLAGFFQSIE